ncbi:MAG: hypothetical protein IH926_10740, partial [Proteobacteria bacterium]|nr:hypothetical protein [Pseudomonadota bacterium]
MPPIGIGKVYADIVSHLRGKFPEHFVELTENLRQLENSATGKGCGILDLAGCFINSCVQGEASETEQQSVRREQLIVKLHEGGDIDKDLRVVYWNDHEALAGMLIKQITADLTNDSNKEK